MKQLNSGPFPAIHAFCKDPSEIHRGYVRTLIDAGVNLDGINCQGYKSLDYAVYNGDSETEAMVVQGLQLQLAGGVESKVKRRRFEATVRKAYRDLFETKLRPLIRSKHRDTLKRMQDLYAVELAKNVFYQETFDQLRYVPYPDFLASQRLPRYADGTLRSHKAPLHPDAKNNAQHVVFVSYRWIRKDPVTGKTAPDDFIHTQYKLMLTALEQYLAVHPELDPAKFGIWMDSASIDRKNPWPGISALPMILTQCNALISIVDETYWTRSWCSVEALMIQILCRNYLYHEWFVLSPSSIESAKAGAAEAESKSMNNGKEQSQPDAGWKLGRGPLDLEIDPRTKHMAWEEDRDITMFLERQARLLVTPHE